MTAGVDTFFSTPLVYDNINIDNDLLETYCYRLKEISNAPIKAGGWQSGMLDLTDIALRELLTQVQLLMQTVEKVLNIDDRVKLKIENGWVNINSPSNDQLANNYYHSHPQFFFSFVYYLKAEEGNLILINPSNILEYAVPDQVFSSFNNFNSSRAAVTPVKGKLIGFPSWVTHFAQPNTGTSDRISLAFNTRLVQK